jgi:phosphatidylserine/phosphatidylglycerophosphate/cardiolipin synthase-like enzyme
LSDRLVELRIENKRLKDQVENLEQKVLSLVGMIELYASGGSENKNVLNDQIIQLINSTKSQLNIVSIKVDRFYTTELKKAAQRGIPILMITNDRSKIPKEYQDLYDELKNTLGIQIINNPNVRYMLIFNNEMAIYSGGSLDKQELENSILVSTTIKTQAKLRKVIEIFNLMLPSFMRT